LKGREDMTNAPELYEIHIKGHIGESIGKQFEGCSVHCQPDGNTILSGRLDQAALHGVLTKIQNLGLTLIAVNQIGEPS
jgi:hypothetical protein